MSLAKFVLFVMGFLVFGVVRSFAGELQFVVTEGKRASRYCAIQQLEEFQDMLAQDALLAQKINDNVDKVEIAVFPTRWENKAPPRVTYFKKDRRLVLLSTYLERREICKTVAKEDIQDQTIMIARANTDFDGIIRRKSREINASLGRVTPPEAKGRMPASVPAPIEE